MKLFIPSVAYISPKSLKYEAGKNVKEYLEKLNVPIINSRSVVFDSKIPSENYAKAKKTVLITTNSQKKLMSCKPSADFQFALSSSCPANCEYCYLQTTQGEKPFMKIFVNVNEILDVIQDHINSNQPNITSFECGSITDPVALEHLTGNLAKCIEFFGNSENGRLRVITKFDNVDSFLSIAHNNHTKFRFSINTPYVINKFEHNTSSFDERIAAAKKIAEANYPIGFILAPLMIYENWKNDYLELISKLKSEFALYDKEITFELIQHRYTLKAKELILTRFPDTLLDMDEKTRRLKWGPYGQFKYVYPKEKSSELKNYLSELIHLNFSNSIIEYFT